MSKKEWSVSDPDHDLTRRQRDVLQLLASGHSLKVTAAQLGVSINTVVYHRDVITRRFSLADKPGLVRLAFRRGLLEYMRV